MVKSYEFSESQNGLIRTLANTMRFVSYFLIAMGVLAGLLGLLTLTEGGIGSIIQAVVQIVIGQWTGKAARSFQLIVSTQGNDVENLMGALAELRKLYTLQYWVMIIALIFLAGALLLVLVGNSAALLKPR